MTDYPYDGRNLFEFPETYQYASCACPEFLDSWHESRSRGLAKFSDYETQPLSGAPGAAGPQVRDPDAVDFSVFLDRLLARLKKEGNDAAEIYIAVSPYIAKYEIFKRLHSHYQANTRKHPDAVLADAALYVKFADCISQVAVLTGFLSPLSTLLKIVDAIASLPSRSLGPEDAALVTTIIKRERALVASLERKTCVP